MRISVFTVLISRVFLYTLRAYELHLRRYSSTFLSRLSCFPTVSVQAFTIIDQNRDGIISKDDLRDVLATMGQLNVKNEELEAMVKEASGPINFTVFLTMFGEKLKGASSNTPTLLKSCSHAAFCQTS